MNVLELRNRKILKMPNPVESVNSKSDNVEPTKTQTVSTSTELDISSVGTDTMGLSSNHKNIHTFRSGRLTTGIFSA